MTIATHASRRAQKTSIKKARFTLILAQATACAAALRAARASGQAQLAAYERCAERHRELDTSYFPVVNGLLGLA